MDSYRRKLAREAQRQRQDLDPYVLILSVLLIIIGVLNIIGVILS